jgi:hypothetical protein
MLFPCPFPTVAGGKASEIKKIQRAMQIYLPISVMAGGKASEIKKNLHAMFLCKNI